MSFVLVFSGSVFFIAGTIGLLRFPDSFTRLHALTKADNLGLGFVVAGLAIEVDEVLIAAKLVFIWVLVMTASATACHLVARSALRSGVAPWRRP